MSGPQSFSDVVSAIEPKTNVTRWSPAAGDRLEDIASTVHQSLRAPLDFPALRDAVVPGDHIVLAIDPNVPRISEVVSGVLRAISETEASHVDAVLWDETDEATIQKVQMEMAPNARVVRHHGSLRRDVRYLAADENGDPVYLNRLLVDADLVIPIAVNRGRIGSAPDQKNDVTGVFPMLADSASRSRYHDALAKNASDDAQAAWLLGVQMMISVSVNQDGDVADVVAGAISAIDQQDPCHVNEDVSGPYQWIVVDLRGDHVLPTWHNVARAAWAVTPLAKAGATIVLWSDLDWPFGASFTSPGEGAQKDEPAAEDEVLPDEFADEDLDNEDFGDESATAQGASADSGEDFPSWDLTLHPRQILSQLTTDYRVLLKSQLDTELMENAGFGVIETSEQLTRLSESFEECLVVRGGHFLTVAVPLFHVAHESKEPND